MNDSLDHHRHHQLQLVLQQNAQNSDSYNHKTVKKTSPATIASQRSTIKLYVFTLALAAFLIVTYIFVALNGIETKTIVSSSPSNNTGRLPNGAKSRQPLSSTMQDKQVHNNVKPKNDDDSTQVKTPLVSSSLSSLSSSLGNNNNNNNSNDKKNNVKSTLSDRKPSWEPFNTTNPYQTSWCPNAQCLNSPLCTPCSRRFFFIVSTARSGSTTLLRMFNALPNLRLSGENHNTLYYTAQISRNLDHQRPRILQHPVDKPTGPFQHNAIPAGSMGCVAQKVVHSLNPPPLRVQREVHLVNGVSMEDYDRGLILGFKTVRVHHGDWSAEEAADYIKSHFPCSKVLINYQTNVTHQYYSFKRTFQGGGANQNRTDDGGGGGAVYKGPSISYFKEINMFQQDLNRHLGEMSRIIDMDQWVNNVEILNDVVDWMGYEKCRFEKIVHENDKGYSTDKETVLSVGEDCVSPW